MRLHELSQKIFVDNDYHLFRINGGVTVIMSITNTIFHTWMLFKLNCITYSNLRAVLYQLTSHGRMKIDNWGGGVFIHIYACHNPYETKKLNTVYQEFDSPSQIIDLPTLMITEGILIASMQCLHHFDPNDATECMFFSSSV